MEINIVSSSNEVPVTTPQQSHAESALARVEELRAFREKIPNLVIPETKDARQRLSVAASVPPEFVELTSMAVKSHAPLVRGGGQDLAQNSDLKSFAEAYGPVADELEALTSFVRHSVTKALNTVGSEALTTYALAKRLAKRPESADLIPHVDAMGKALGKRVRKSKSKPAPTPATPGTPAPTEPSPVTPPSSTTTPKTA
jgi:hypothetical protein